MHPPWVNGCHSLTGAPYNLDPNATNGPHGETCPMCQCCGNSPCCNCQPRGRPNGFDNGSNSCNAGFPANGCPGNNNALGQFDGCRNPNNGHQFTIPNADGSNVRVTVDVVRPRRW